MKIGFAQQYSNVGKIIYNAGTQASYEYFTTSRIKKSAPDVRLVFSPWFLPFVPVEILSQDVGGLIQTLTFQKSRSAPHGTVVLTMAADEEAAAGLFSKFGIRTIADILQPRTMCQLWVDGFHIFDGYVVSIRRTVSVGKGKVYNIEFDEIGALYQQSIVDYANIRDGVEMSLVNDYAKILSDGARKWPGPLSLSIYQYLEAFRQSTLNFGTKGYLRASDGLPLAYRLVALPPPLGGISLTGLLSQIITNTTMFDMAGGTSFWDFLKRYVPSPFMEFYTESGGRTICTGRIFGGEKSPEKLADGNFFEKLSANPLIPKMTVATLLPGFNYMILRSAPYDNLMIGSSTWHSVLRPFTLDVFDLILAGDFIIVTDDDIISKTLGQSDEQQYTVFDTPFGGGAAANGATLKNRPSVSRGPLNPLSPGGIRTYGAKVLKAPIDVLSVSWTKLVGQSIENFTRTVGGNNPACPITVNSLSSMLNYWFRNAAKFNEGQITTRAFPYAKPGMVLLYLPSLDSGSVEHERDIGIYYIDNVTYTYGLGQAATSTFSVIRGVPLPLNMGNLIKVFADWEIFPVGLNVADSEVL